MNQKPLIAVSRCLLGERVRYDGDCKPELQLINDMEKYFSIIGVCPEVESGLSVPRPPVRLMKVNITIRALGVEDAALDITDGLINFAETFVDKHPELCGLILKARSPSCGIGNTPIYPEGMSGDGLFATTVAQLLPDIPMINETGLLSEQEIQIFVERVEYYSINVKK